MRRTSTHRSSARFIARVLPGAAPAPFPGFVVPCEPKLRPSPPRGDRWISEIKHDGYRVQAHLEGGRARIFTRHGHDWTSPFSALAKAVTELPANTLILDGEVVVQGESGIADFDALQDDLAAGRSDRMVYFAFDLLYLDGFDLRNAPLIERKRVLAALLEEARSECIQLSQHLETEPGLVYQQAYAMGLEGIICKLRDGPYRSGSRAIWLKILCVTRGVFPIVGFVAAGDGIAALHLARRRGKELAYIGKAGTGFTQKSSRELRRLLEPLVIDRPALTHAVRKTKATWVRPELSAEIQYRAVTSDGLLRHASFKGLHRSAGGRRRSRPEAWSGEDRHISRCAPGGAEPALKP